MANTRDPVSIYVYNDDAGKKRHVHLTASVAAFGGFTAAGTDAPDAAVGKLMRMRKLFVASDPGNGSVKVFRDSCPMASPTTDKYAGLSAAGDLGGRSNWHATGRTGEHVKSGS